MTKEQEQKENVYLEVAHMIESLPKQEKEQIRAAVSDKEVFQGLEEHLRAYAEFINIVSKKEAKQLLLDALDAPLILRAEYIKETPAKKESLAETISNYLDKLDDDIKANLRAAIQEHTEDGLTAIELKILNLLKGTLFFKLNKEQIGRIAATLGADPKTIKALAREIIQRGIITIQEDEDAYYLPGLEPELPRYPAPTYILPDKTRIPSAHLFRQIQTIDTRDGEGEIAQLSIPVDPKPHQRYVYMQILNKMEERYPISHEDKNILIALGNLYAERKTTPGGTTGLQGGSIVTADDLIKRIRGIDDSGTHTTADACYRVSQRMARLINMDVSFDFTQHFEYNKVGDDVQLSITDDMKRKHKDGLTPIRFSYTGKMVHANIIEVEYQSGRIERAWEILTPPIVYDYAKKIKQIATIETKLLDLRKKANSNTETDVVKVYLLEQIIAMKRSGRSKRMKLETIFDELRITVNNRATRKRKIDLIKRILDHFKDQEDEQGNTFIKGYEIEKGYRGVTIAVNIITD